MAEFITKYNYENARYNDYIYWHEESDPTVITEPGLAMDVPTMLRRYAQGTLSGLSVRNPIFDDSDEPDPTEAPDFDLTDAEAYLRHVSEKISRSKNSRIVSPETDPIDDVQPNKVEKDVQKEKDVPKKD